jgi:uncharacterized protein YndB with AHSA1/START domain
VALRTRPAAARALALDRGFLVLADIAGYTSYVVSSPLEHAEDVLSDVTATVAERLGHVLTLNKYEGDAVFGYALDGELDGTMLLDAVEECYFGFRNRLVGMQHATSCSCSACAKLPDLDLKFVVHYGGFIRRPGSGGEELTGEDVIVAHRLLKNTAPTAFGVRGYALFSAASVAALGLDPAALGLREHLESYEDVGEVRCFVADLEARWVEERERRRVFVGEGEAAFEIEAILPVPPPIAWEYLTAPASRSLWQGQTVESAHGGRRGAGTRSFCVDGRSRFYEEILDWRPFSYFTEARSLPGSAKVVLTTELTALEGGTRMRTRGALLDGRGRAAWLLAGRRVVRSMRDGYRRLGDQIVAAEEAAEA